MVNLMAVGTFAFGDPQDRLGHIRSIALTLIGWIAMILLAVGRRPLALLGRRRDLPRGRPRGTQPRRRSMIPSSCSRLP